MIILLFAFSINAIAAAVIIWLVLQLTAKTIPRIDTRRFVRVLAIAIVAFLGLCMCLPTASFLFGLTVSSGTNISADDYHALGPSLPTAASAISFHADFRGSEAIFTICESDFVAWINTEKWDCVPIAHAEFLELPRFGREVEAYDGIKVSEMFHPRGTGVDILFDRKSETCYYRFASY